MESFKNTKDRLLSMHSRLMEGKMLYKAEEAKRFGCSLRSIQRDIDDLRSFFFNQSEYGGIAQELIYDKKLNAYRLEPPLRNVLTNQEVFAVLKIMLESRSLSKQELYPILEKLIDCCIPRENKKMVTDLIGNEKLHYVEPKHKTVVLDRMWDLAYAVKEQLIIDVTYKGSYGTKLVVRKLKPVGIMFSEFYFYLTAFIVSDENPETIYPTIYRFDRIVDMVITNEHFRVPYAERFEEGEFRKRIQFMQGGELQKIKFYFNGPSIEAILDRLPTAQILKQDEKGYLVQAEVFGKGVDMWLKTQGDWVKRVE
ncbi:MAG: WYL domain-containing protein [Phascolarctobacterium sp.]|nr:WYL domain-containing protein [Phascolarctobacterium sp.]MBR6511836.1 WYL domain-containing protein [Phascolarctobacterium sp.]